MLPLMACLSLCGWVYWGRCLLVGVYDSRGGVQRSGWLAGSVGHFFETLNGE